MRGSGDKAVDGRGWTSNDSLAVVAVVLMGSLGHRGPLPSNDIVVLWRRF